MRNDNTNFAVENLSNSLESRYSIELSFDDANTDIYYLTSHDDVDTPNQSQTLYNVVEGLSVTSQAVFPEKARATIGRINFQAINKNNALRDVQFTKLQVGKSLKKKRIRYLVGYEGLDYADYVVVQTQLIDDVSYEDGLYNFRCSDIQREQKKKIFDNVKTNIQSTIPGPDDPSYVATGATIAVYDTANFEYNPHGSEYSDEPNTDIIYFKIKTEIFSATGKTASSFTGVTRGALNTVPIEHTVDPASVPERRPEVSEYIYLEMSSPKLIYAILTGKLQNQPGKVLPSNWHLGISEEFVNLDSFTNIGSDLWDTTLDTGLTLVFRGETKTDGKKFIEEQLLFLSGLYMPIYNDGKLNLKRMTGVLSNASPVFTLDYTNVESYGDLKHNYNEIINNITINWNYNDDKKTFTRQHTLLDADSVSIYKLSTNKFFNFRGLNGSRHSAATLNDRFDAVRDRFSGPPLTIDVECLPIANKLEVGDIVKLNLPDVEDYISGGSLNRSFEIQKISINWVTGRVKFSLFGSSRKASSISYDSGSVTLPDSVYSISGNNLATYQGGGYDYTTDFDLVGDVGHIISNCQLTGGNDMNNSSYIFYYLGDLTIDDNITLTITDNVQLRVMGFLQINGTINGEALGLAGANKIPDANINKLASRIYNYYESRVDQHNAGTAGFLGTTISGGGIFRYVQDPELADRQQITLSLEGHTVIGLNQVTPKLNIEFDGSDLIGIPSDMRGSSGSSGRVSQTQYENSAFGNINYNGFIVGRTINGGDGGDGGSGLFILCRGSDFGVSGKIITSGGDGGPPSHIGFYPPEDPANDPFDSTSSHFTAKSVHDWGGNGAGGSPGAVYFCLDGSASNIPSVTTETMQAKFGNMPMPCFTSTEGLPFGYQCGRQLNKVSMTYDEVTEFVQTYAPEYGIPELGLTFSALNLYSYYNGTGADDNRIDLSGDAGAFNYQFINTIQASEEDLGEFLLQPSSLIVTSGTADLLTEDDGTIVVRAKLSWTKSDDERTTAYEIQYKESANSNYLSANAVLTGTETYISNLKSGINHDFRIRSANALGQYSDWVYYLNHTVLGKDQAPSNVITFNVYQNGEAAIFKWGQVSDPDLQGYEIRYNVKGNLNWEDGTVLTEVTRGTNITTADLPDGSWSVMIKPVDTSGNYSINIASSDIDFVSNYDVITRVPQAPEWLGTLTGFVKHWTGKLGVVDQNIVAGNYDNFEWCDNYCPNPVLDSHYTAPEIDIGFDDQVRIWGDIISVLGPGEITGNANPHMKLDYRLEAGSYDGFEDWSVGLASARYFKHHIHSDNEFGKIVVTGFKPTVDNLEFTQKASGVTISPTGTTINYPIGFHLIPYVSVIIISNTALYATIENVTETSFDVHIFNSSGTEVGGTVNWQATGV